MSDAVTPFAKAEASPGAAAFLESLNSVLIRQGLRQPERLATLNGTAITQMRTLLSANPIKRLK